MEQRLKEQKLEAKRQLDRVLEDNQHFQAAKQAALAAERKEEKQCMEDYSKVLEKQEMQRAEQLKKIQALQEANEAQGVGRGETKRWMDPTLIEKHAMELTKRAIMKEESDRETNSRMNKEYKQALDKQLTDKKEAQKQKEKLKQDEKARILSEVSMEAKRQEERKKSRSLACMKFKSSLDKQLMEHKRDIVSKMGMTWCERQLNSTILKQARQQQSSS